MLCFLKCLIRRAAITILARVCSFLIVNGQPLVQIVLQLLNIAVNFFAECNLIKLILDGAMKPLANAIGLRTLGLGTGMVDVLNGQV